MDVAGTNVSEYLLTLCSTLDKMPEHQPDLIVSSGGKSAFASLVLKRRWRIPNIFVGVPAPFPDRWFDLIVSPVPREFRTASVVTGLIPNTVTPEQVRAAGEQYWKGDFPASPCWALLIGGDSKSHRFSDADWQGLIDGVNALARRRHMRWLVTTSRRTPAEVEAKLAKGLEPHAVAALVLYNQNPQKVVQPFLAVAERVMVTQDSLTMASEALCSGVPVTLLAPQRIELEPGSYFEEMVNGFPRLPGVERVSMRMLAGYEGGQGGHHGDTLMSLDPIGAELVQAVRRLTGRAGQ
jgi:mitochondrial fission protein ELM1